MGGEQRADVPLGAQAAGLDLAAGKRPRSFTSELAAEPLHPSKQSLASVDSHGPARSSPTMVQARIMELRSLIATERKERQALLDAMEANSRLLQELQADNKELMRQ